MLIRSALAASLLLILATNVPPAAAADPGVTATEIKLGQTMPYSGPASAYAAFGKAELAYMRMVNDRGGVHGRKINLISLDDGYSRRARSSRPVGWSSRRTCLRSSPPRALRPTPSSANT